MRDVKNYINGEFKGSVSASGKEVINPATEEVIAKTPFSTTEEVNEVIQKAKVAFQSWSKTPVVDRIQPLFKLKTLLEEHSEKISTIITEEHGKTLVESRGDLRRAIQMVEMAISAPVMLQGKSSKDVAKRIDSFSYRRPMGVFAGINPFNFPAMVPFWFWPFAVASGNCFVVKPSERVPLTQQYIFELIDQCDFPPGVISMIHGGADVVNQLIDHPDIEGLSFVGSTPVAQHIYEQGHMKHKRVQALGGAKNFLVLMDDAPIEKSVRAMVDSCYGCAGERCLAGSVLVAVGDRAYQSLREKVVMAAKEVIVGDGLDPKVTMGPVISLEARERINQDIETAISEGAELIYDGRTKIEKGYFQGPVVLDNVLPNTMMATKEIFGPVIGLMKVDNIQEAIDLVNSSEYANTCSIFTSSGQAAREFSHEVHPSMVGVNLGVPAPMSFFSFGGSKKSFFGDLKAHGHSGFQFFTEELTVMERWFEGNSSEDINPHWKK